MAEPTAKRQAVSYIVDHYDLKTQRACRLTKQARSTYYYQSVKDPQTALRHRVRKIAQTRVRYGYQPRMWSPCSIGCLLSASTKRFLRVSNGSEFTFS